LITCSPVQRLNDESAKVKLAQVALLDVTDLGGGVYQARVSVDGVEYSVKAGDVFATNYKLVVFTSPTCANFTFADSPFSLCTGEQVIK